MEKRSTLIVVKLGGSSITEKGSFETLKRSKLDTTCFQIQQIFRETGANVILIHGAGSFGHHQAKQYGLKSGGGDDWLVGVSRTRSSVLRLNAIILQSLAALDVPVAPVSPFDFITLKDGDVLRSTLTEHMSSLLRTGLIPLAHGDVVLDRKRKCSIMSGDGVMQMY